MPGPSLRSEFVRFDEAAKRGDEAVAYLLAPTRGLELVDIQIHRDRKASVSHLPLNANGIEATLGEVRPIRVTEIVERELRDTDRIEAAASAARLMESEARLPTK